MFARRLWLLLIISIFMQQIFAHEVRPALLKLTTVSEGQWDAVFKQPQVQGRFLDLRVKTNCLAGDSTNKHSGTAQQETFTLICDESGLNFIEIEGLDRTMIDTMVTVDDGLDDISNYLISASQPTLFLERGFANSRLPSVPAYLLLGIEHLLFGIDHVFFVLVLLYLVSGWRNLIKVVTSFTLAHSITLGLAAYGVVNVSQAPIEALIALSIVLLALESLKSTRGVISQSPWLIAFLFGLLHGLGFASALAEIGLPEENTISALFMFNVGIELGQLAIVASALAAVYVLHRIPFRFAPITRSMPLYAVGSVASYWFIERAAQIIQ